MSDSAIAIRYAKALLNIAEEQKLIERFSDEVGQLAELLKKEDLLRLLLDSPTFPLEKKLAIMRDIGDKLQLSAGLQNFLDLLLQKGRIIYLGDSFSRCRQGKLFVLFAEEDRENSAIPSTIATCRRYHA